MCGRTARIHTKRWFDGLHPQAATKIAAARARLEAANTSSLKRLGSIAEYRIDWGPGYRIYLAVEGTTIVILFGGGTKKGQQSDIRRARQLFEEYETRKTAVKNHPSSTR